MAARRLIDQATAWDPNKGIELTLGLAITSHDLKAFPDGTPDRRRLERETKTAEFRTCSIFDD
jgi:hypothetical protein